MNKTVFKLRQSFVCTASCIMKIVHQFASLASIQKHVSRSTTPSFRRAVNLSPFTCASLGLSSLERRRYNLDIEDVRHNVALRVQIITELHVQSATFLSSSMPCRSHDMKSMLALSSTM